MYPHLQLNVSTVFTLSGGKAGNTDIYSMLRSLLGTSGQGTYWDWDQNSFGGSNYVHNGPGSPVVVPVVFQHLYCLSAANEAWECPSI